MNLKMQNYKDTEQGIIKRIGYIEDVLFAEPGNEIIKLRAEAFEIIEKFKDDEVKMKQVLTPLAQREREWVAVAAAQQNSQNLVKEINALEEDLVWIRKEIKEMMN